MADVELQLPLDYGFVALARLVVVAAARNAGMDEARREDLRIAVSEATTSAIEACERASRTGPVVLRFGEHEDGFEVTVSEVGGPPETAGAGLDGGIWPGDTGQDHLATTVIRGLVEHVERVHREGSPAADLRFTLGLRDGDALAGARTSGPAADPGA